MTGLSWGKALEPDARACYAFHADCEPQTVGFVLRDEDRMCGASPDALVGESGLLELKCPMAGSTCSTWPGMSCRASMRLRYRANCGSPGASGAILRATIRAYLHSFCASRRMIDSGRARQIHACVH